MILKPADALSAGESRVGGKAFGLARLTSVSDVEVPDWFAIPGNAFWTHAAATGQISKFANNMSDAGIVELRDLIEKSEIDEVLKDAIAASLKDLKGPFAVRSSMVGEDSATASFAGQLESFLYQESLDDVLESVKKCWASAFTPHAIAYRERHGLSGLPLVGVVVQSMVTGDVSGVAFTADPTTGARDNCRITSAWGLCEGVVNGACNTDEFVVSHDGKELEAKLANKDIMVVAAEGGGTQEIDVEPDKQDSRSLSTSQLKTLTKTIVGIANEFARPQDIEWTFDGDQLYILQSRPITALPAPENTSGPRVVFDNSNIQESYCGVTTPLTFSFAQAAYASVYEQTMRALGLGDDVIEAHSEMLRNMIGLVRGRVYYNINNWYRGLLLLPSFGRNKEDMEAMMGLEVPVDFVEGQEFTFAEKLAKLPGMLATFAKLLWLFRGLDKAVPKFLADFEAAYQRIDRSRFKTATYSELIAVTEQIRVEMLENWSTPIINDTFVLMKVGALRRLVEKSGLPNVQEIVNNLMSGEEGIESLEPTRVLMRLARDARKDEALLAALNEGETSTTLERLRKSHPEFTKRVDAYIERYGDRVIGELKLETITAREDTSFIIQVLRNFAAREDLDPDALAAHEAELRSNAEKALFGAISGFDRLRVPKALKTARKAVKFRENMRLARTRMFGLIRDAYAAIGMRLHEAGKLDHPRDVFYLTTDEMLAYHEGRAVTADLAAIAAARRAEYAEYERLELPHHFETIGPVYHGNAYRGPEFEIDFDPDADVLVGTGCYPGVVNAPLRVVMSPSDNLDLEGHILTTLRTDPGWAPLFPASAGILVERGSTLSHSAVVARELGIPAVVGVPGLLKSVEDGEAVELDGGAGTVKRKRERERVSESA